MTADEDPAEAFARKAPQLTRDELATIVREELLVGPIRKHCESVWLYGSFVNSDAELDIDGDVSGLEVYVTVDPSILPSADAEVSTRFSATQRGVLGRLAMHDVIDIYGQPEPRFVSFPLAPESLLESLRTAERAVFHVRESDREQLNYRGLKLTIGTRAALDELLDRNPALRLWARDE